MHKDVLHIYTNCQTSWQKDEMQHELFKNGNIYKSIVTKKLILYSLWTPAWMFNHHTKSEVNTNVIYMIEINYGEETPPPYWEFVDDSESEPVFFNNGCNSVHTTCQDYTQPKSPSAASHGCLLQIDSLWEIIKTRCSFLKHNSLQDLGRALQTHQPYYHTVNE